MRPCLLAAVRLPKQPLAPLPVAAERPALAQSQEVAGRDQLRELRAGGPPSAVVLRRWPRAADLGAMRWAQLADHALGCIPCQLALLARGHFGVA